MGLNTKPSFRLLANSQDITDTLRRRFVSLRLTDEAGLQSDALEVTLTDHDVDNPIRLPATGAELELWLGYDGQAQRMGLFVVDGIELSGPPSMLVIRAKAATQDQTPAGKTGLQTQKTRSWPVGTTLADMAATIASEHGLTAAVAATLGSITLPHVDQVGESDINLLTRLAKDYDAIAKPAGGKLVLARRGESKTTSGQQLSGITVTPQQVTTWRMSMNKRTAAGTVVAVWRDLATAQDREVSAGSGEPVKRLRHQYSDQATAEQAAKAELNKGKRSERQLSIALPGSPALIAEAPLVMSGFREGVAGEWLITRVEHSLDGGGYRCSVSADWK